MSSTIIIIALVVLQFGNLGVIAYLVKRLMDEQPISVSPTARPDTPPVVLTRADNRRMREIESQDNLHETKKDNQLVDLDDLPPEIGMAAFDTRGEE